MLLRQHVAVANGVWFHAPFGDSLEAGLELLLHDVFPVSTQDAGHQLEQQRAVTEFQGVQQLKSEYEETALDFLGDVRRLACCASSLKKAQNVLSQRQSATSR